MLLPNLLAQRRQDPIQSYFRCIIRLIENVKAARSRIISIERFAGWRHVLQELLGHVLVELRVLLHQRPRLERLEEHWVRLWLRLERGVRVQSSG